MSMRDIFALLREGKNVDISSELKFESESSGKCDPKIPLIQNSNVVKNLEEYITELLTSPAKLDDEIRNDLNHFKNDIIDGKIDDRMALSFMVSLAKVFDSFMRKNYESYMGQYSWDNYVIDEFIHDIYPKDMILEVCGFDIGTRETCVVTMVSASMAGKHRITLTHLFGLEKDADDKGVKVKYILSVPQLS